MTKPSWQDFATHDESAYPELWDGVVGAWAPCLGPTGSRLHDHSRRANWGTLTNMDNATNWVIDGGQYALNFDGSNDRTVVSGSVTRLISGPLTISGWISGSTNNGVRAIASSIQSTYAFQLEVGRTSQRLVFVHGSSVVVTSTQSIASNTWAHVAATRSGITGAWSVSVWVNGQSTTATTTDNPGADNADINIGFNTVVPTWAFNGNIDDIVVWDRALSPNEIRQLYQLGRGGMYQRRRRRAIYLPQAGFQPAWALRRSQVIGGGLR